MKGIVTKLCDIENVDIPAGMLDVSVSEQSVADEIERLALRYAKESEADVSADGDIVYCAIDGGRVAPVFTAPVLPGAEEAAKSVLGKRAGDVVETSLLGKSVKLTAVKIVRRTLAEVNDALIASLGIEGASDMASYREYVRNKMISDKRFEAGKELSHYLMDELISGSSFEYDEAEMEEYISASMPEWLAECAAAGMDITEDDIRQSILFQSKQEWAAEAVCRKLGREIDLAEAEAEADRMAEMMALMGESVPERDELVKMSIRDAYQMVMFEYIDGIAASRMGGSNGNG